MRELKCLQMSGMYAQEVLDEFNDRRKELGISDSDIVSVSALPPTFGAKVIDRAGKAADPKIEVVIVYWGHALAD
jgi:hypothetical protein